LQPISKNKENAARIKAAFSFFIPSHRISSKPASLARSRHIQNTFDVWLKHSQDLAQANFRFLPIKTKLQDAQARK
jgi:hypothetical protein